ncbi:MAG: Glu/Leu/Phe/Val dehydrogenase [Alphaproteobacteria bacterium]|nr:Glu/Leu/Phe/Val dehydrogenase [Alphaproteobacteria bacterium]
MPEVFEFCDDLGPAKVIHVHEPTIGLKGILVVDNVAAGPSIGGLRMAPDVSVSECHRLARAMTLKSAAAGLPHGGGKSVLFGEPRQGNADKERLIRGFAYALRNEADYIFGPDMGTDELCMAWVKDEIGRSVGLPREVGGIPLDEIGATGWGVFNAIETALPDAGFELAGATVAIQGYGAVGRHTARFLAEREAIIVAASDSQGTIVNPTGLDLAELDSAKKNGGSVTDANCGEARDRDAIIDIACDIWVPAARPDVVTEANVDRLQTKLVAQGANIPFTDAAERSLHERGVLCLPDFIANAGGVICAAMEYAGASQSAAFDAIAEKIRYNTRAVIDLAKVNGFIPREVAISMATDRVHLAMATRRWSIF